MNEKDVVEILNLISRQWALPVLSELGRGTRSHNDLARAINASHQQLARVLRPLVNRHMVYRKVHAVTPPVRVYYTLTPRGKAVLRLCREFRVLFEADLVDAM